jgi:hypothetical protein
VVWWTSNQEDEVEFFDSEKTGVESRAEGPKLHHFHSSNFKEEEADLKDCWPKCLEAKIPLPPHVLRVKDVYKDIFM